MLATLSGFTVNVAQTWHETCYAKACMAVGVAQPWTSYLCWRFGASSAGRRRRQGIVVICARTRDAGTTFPPRRADVIFGSRPLGVTGRRDSAQTTAPLKDERPAVSFQSLASFLAVHARQRFTATLAPTAHILVAEAPLHAEEAARHGIFAG